MKTIAVYIYHLNACTLTNPIRFLQRPYGPSLSWTVQNFSWQNYVLLSEQSPVAREYFRRCRKKVTLR